MPETHPLRGSHVADGDVALSISRDHADAMALPLRTFSQVTIKALAARDCLDSTKNAGRSYEPAANPESCNSEVAAYHNVDAWPLTHSMLSATSGRSRCDPSC